MQDNTLVCSLEDPKHSNTKIQNQPSCIFWLLLATPDFFELGIREKKSGAKKIPEKSVFLRNKNYTRRVAPSRGTLG